MFDGIKIANLSVSTDALLHNDRLIFPLSVDEQTGAIFDRPRYAIDRGLTFILTPKKTVDGVRCELRGSLHKYHNDGRHNANEFTAVDLLATIHNMVKTFGIDPFTSRLNNVEFGVNVVLPFPVNWVLNNLISYKNRPFITVREPGEGFSYYQCATQRYVVKLYDKGSQYNLPDNMLRVEVKVLKMEYLKNKGVRLSMLADLLLIDNYVALGGMLFDIFNEILFDEPTINTAALTNKERDVYQNGRNPRLLSIPDDLTGKEYERRRKALQRAETKFRALINQHRQGDDRQSITAALIGQTWERLATIDDDLLTRISEHRVSWQSMVKLSVGTVDKSKQCPKLTGSDAGLSTGEMSQINPLYVVLKADNGSTDLQDLNPSLDRGLISAQFFEWQRTNPPFNRMGLASLSS